MQKKNITRLVSTITALGTLPFLYACNSSVLESDASANNTSTKFPQSAYSGHSKLNQLGYYPNANKVVIVPSQVAIEYTVSDQQQNLVIQSTSSSAQKWKLSGESIVKIDLTQLNQVGIYTLNIPSLNMSNELTIGTDQYMAVHDAALKAYYFNRASLALSPELAGPFARNAGHADTHVKVHASAASATRPAGTIISSPKGWYDAGDYNKYIVNSGISVYTLMLAYEHFESFYKNKALEIPEADNTLPDLLDEIAWNVEWMATMQDPADGGVYHKLTTLNFSGKIMPEDGTEQRYVVQKSTAASLNFAATMAYASRLYKPFDTHLSSTYLKQAFAAFEWASKNPTAIYEQPKDVKTGEYGDNVVTDEFAWAAAELFLASDNKQFLTSFDKLAATPSVPSWSDSSALAYISLLTNGKDNLAPEKFEQYKRSYLSLATRILNEHKQSPYGVAMTKRDFVWGSNAVALNKALVLWQAYRLTGNPEYQLAGEGLLNYTLGTNPTAYSYVTGFGEFSPSDPHHRPSVADAIDAPVPGFLVGGPHSGQQDKCDYPSDLPARSYIDDWCSYSTNEVTINWNAPLVYALIHVHTKHTD